MYHVHNYRCCVSPIINDYGISAIQLTNGRKTPGEGDNYYHIVPPRGVVEDADSDEIKLEIALS